MKETWLVHSALLLSVVWVLFFKENESINLAQQCGYKYYEANETKNKCPGNHLQVRLSVRVIFVCKICIFLCKGGSMKDFRSEER